MGINTVNEDMNPILEEVVGNLDSFIENINCLRETYDFSKGMLNQQLLSASKNYESFIAPFNSSEENGKISVERAALVVDDIPNLTLEKITDAGTAAKANVEIGRAHV